MADDSDDDLFADFAHDEVKTESNISANLLQDIGYTQDHQGEADEGPMVTWVAPKFSGLDNSNAVSNSAGSHWYRDAAEEELWNELLDDDDNDDEDQDGGGTNLSENLMTTPQALLAPQAAADAWLVSVQHNIFGAKPPMAPTYFGVVPRTPATATAMQW